MKAVIVDLPQALLDERRAQGLDLFDDVVVDVPQALLDERRIQGVDKRDEVWEGVLHMVPPPSSEHQHIEGELFAVLRRGARARGLVAWVEPGFYRAPDDYRVPDLAVARPEHRTPAGIGGAELVVEIRSPRDGTDRKLDWYAARGVAEILAVDQRTRAVELYAGRDGRAVRVPNGTAGDVDLATVGLRLAPVEVAEGRHLHVTGDGIDELI